MGIKCLRSVAPEGVFLVKFDVAIVGGGHNALVHAGYLAKAGARVVVLERRPILGGACVTEEPWPGYRINTYAYVAGLLRPNIAEELELSKFGYSPILYDPQAFCPFPDGRSLSLWNDTDKTVKEIAKFSKKDAAAYPKYEEFWDNVLDLVEPLMLAPPVPLADLVSQFPGAEAEELVRSLFLLSAQDFLDEWFESDHVKVAFATNAVIGEMAGPRTPGTAYVLAHHNIGVLEGSRKVWGFSKGGMGRITEAMAKSAQHHGAVLRTGVTVKEILVHGGRAVGVELEGGERIEARAVSSSVDAKQTFLHLVPREHLSSDVVREVERIKSRGAALKFNAALSGLPKFTVAPETPGPHHRGAIELCPSMEYLEKAYDDGKYGRFSEHPFIDCELQSVLDPSMAPPGRHVMTCFVQYAPYELRGTTWDEFKPKAAERILDTYAEYAPNIRDVVEHWQVISPLDIERTLGLTGGNIFQGDITPDQIFSFRPILGWSGYRTPVTGLYLCGSAAHPGGGVTGAPGHNAAQVVLEDLPTLPA
ncbi:MAG: NAD(P)/FAD-dependent oxidoreductase [Thermoplasmata archaeon]|nr:NAD(P)/FAD-dependent oxidoreductase [Thermoplasmata archaeon]